MCSCGGDCGSSCSGMAISLNKICGSLYRQSRYKLVCKIEKDTCTPMFTEALFTIPRTWKQLRYPSAGEWIEKLWYIYTMEYSVQFCSVTHSCLTLCDPMDCSMPGFPVHHQLLEFTQTYVHWVGDATQPSHLLSSPSPPALSLSQHQGLLKWVNSSHQVVKVLEFQL